MPWPFVPRLPPLKASASPGGSDAVAILSLTDRLSLPTVHRPLCGSARRRGRKL